MTAADTDPATDKDDSNDVVQEFCRYCRTTLKNDTLLCTECGKWRSKLRNDMLFWSSLVGLMSFVLSTSAFIYASSRSYSTRLFGADLQIRNVSSLKQLTLANNSTEGLIVGKVTFGFPGGKKTQIIVDQGIEPGKVLYVDAGELFVKQTIGGQLAFFAPNRVGSLVAETELKPQELTALKNDLGQADYSSYTVEAINKGGADDELYSSSGSKHIRLPCTIDLDYQVVAGVSKSIKTECAGLVRHRVQSAGR